MTIYDTSAILGRAETELYNTDSTTGKSELDKEDFLTLLVAQLEYQDPMNPMDDTEFTAQLASFSSLEQLTNISDGVDSLNENTVQQDLVSAVGFIGKDVLAEGSTLSIYDGEMSVLYYALGETAANVYINIFDSNGNLVRTATLGGKQAGEHEFQWDGLDWAGEELEDGVYSIGLAAESLDGDAVLSYTEVSGRVQGVQTWAGEQYLRLADGRVVNFNQVSEVVDPSKSEATETEEE